MTSEAFHETVMQLDGHVTMKLRKHPELSEDAIIHHFLSTLGDLTVTEWNGLLDAYKERRERRKATT